MTEKTIQNNSDPICGSPEAVKAAVIVKKKIKRLDVHLEAFITLLLLVALFFAADSLW